MERHSLIHHIYKQQRLAQAISARHTLAQHTRRQQSVPQALGLRAKTTQPFSNPRIQSVRRLQPLLPRSDGSELQTMPASYPYNEVDLSPTQLTGEPLTGESQASIDVSTLDVDQSLPEQDAEAVSLNNLAEDIHNTPPAISTTQQEPTSTTNAPATPTPETPTSLPYQETIQPNLLDTKHTTANAPGEDLPLSAKIPPAPATQEVAQIAHPKDESGQPRFNNPDLPHTLAVAADLASASGIASPSSHYQQNDTNREDQAQTAFQEQRPRKRGRIEEQPQLSTSSYHQAVQPPEEIQRNKPKSKMPATPPTNTETKNNGEQPISAIDTPQTSKFSPQEWYARLVKAEQEAQVKQQTIRNIEPGMPDEQFPTTNRKPTNDTNDNHEPPVRNDTTPLKNMPFTAKSTNRAAIIANESPTPTTPTTSTPLSQRARRFLRPLVGIDPTSVHIHRGRQAEQLTTTYRADAITVGNDIAIAAEHPDDTPETLGLLAHELTHVARQREPRFIPPIVRPANTATTSANQLAQPGVGTPGNAKINNPSTSAIRYNTSAPADEEALAQQVEARVTRAAKNVVSQNTSTNSLWAGPTELTNTHATKPVFPAEPELTSNSTGNAWGGLPAPWEPLPDWLVGAGLAPAQNPTIPTLTSSAPIQTTQWHNETGTSDNPTANSNNSGAINVQRAGKERTLADDSSSSQQSTTTGAMPAGDSQQELEPDLDDLARQVYTRLKHRLGVENRRERL